MADLGRDNSMRKSTLREHEIEDLRLQLHRDFDRRIDNLLDNNKSGLSSLTTTPGHSRNASNIEIVGPPPHTGRKVFRLRESMITTILRIHHIRTIQHVFIASLVIVVMDSAVRDVVRFQIPDILKLEAVRFAFGQFDQVIVIWIWMFAMTLGTYVLFHVWAHRPYDPIGTENYVWLASYAAYLCAFAYYPVRFLVENAIPPASAMTVATEQVRLAMKIHAFVRENIPRALRVKKEKAEENHEDQEESPCSDFSQFLYFLFCPTLVYRDEYPRTEKVCWSAVMEYFMSFAACVFYANYLLVHFAKPVFENFAREKVTVASFLEGVFGCVFPASMVFLLTFYGMLHCWMNAFAEMLRFGDRLFYRDWWNSTSFSNYYRTWNMVIHDWLYNYVYLDMKESRLAGKTTASLTVFFISAVVHEFIITATFRFFYPVLFALFFGFGVLVFFITSSWKHYNVIMNVFMWFALFLGVGVCMCLYSIEYYARRNCLPSYDKKLLDLLVPRSWICNQR